MFNPQKKMKKKTLKCLMLSLGLATMTLAANNLNAQTGGAFGRGGHEEAGGSQSGVLDRSSSSGTGYHISTEHFDNGGTSGMFHIGTQQFGQDVNQPVPLGSGLFIMAAAGAAYALKKRKMNK